MDTSAGPDTMLSRQTLLVGLTYKLHAPLQGCQIVSPDKLSLIMLYTVSL